MINFGNGHTVTLDNVTEGNLTAGNFLFQPEKINAYEGGYKAAFLNREVTLASSVFYYDYHNMQTEVFDPIAHQAIVNVPRARIYGAELEGTAERSFLRAV